MAKRHPEAEKMMGLRCHCGRQIETGWEWYGIGFDVDKATLEPKSYSETVRTCGDEDCPVAKQLLEQDSFIARMAIEIEWLVESFPGEPTPIVGTRPVLEK